MIPLSVLSLTEMIYGLKIFFVVSAVLLLAIGFHKRNHFGHLLSSLGWCAFSLYWLTHTPSYLSEGNYFNAFFSGGAVPFFLFIGYNEYLLRNTNEDNHSLKFLAGTGFIAGAIYFLIEYVTYFHTGLLYITAYQTKFFLHLFGYEIELGEMIYTDKVRIPILKEGHAGKNISIVLACTAIQSIVIFIGAIYSTRGDRRRKIKAFLLTVPVVYLLNTVRNGGVIYLVYEGYLRFEVAHNYLSRYGAMAVLVILVYLMFNILPELHEDIMGIMELFIKPFKERKEKKD
ncbi:MAG TPA: archaeosortase A [Thermoplasmata archaeon]|nr:archaeosortase A [Thermoplasmata archaeon]